MELAQVLAEAGYHRVPVERSEVGHFHAPASLNGRPVSILLDTGASCTLVSLAVARDLELDLSLSDDTGGGAGSASMELYVVEGVTLELAGLQVRPRAVAAMDLSHANQALVEKGAAPIEAILGLDVFEEHAAIIDYGSQSLFLRP